MTAGGVPLVQARGDPFEVGYQHGRALGPGMRAFIDDGLGRISRLARPR